MCIFCDIVSKKIPSTVVYENEYVLCFDDIKPAAPVHVLVVPKKHFDDITVLASESEGSFYMSQVISAISEVARIKGLEKGFRVINNCREDGGQTVMHVHFHVLGGLKLSEKML